MPTRLASFLLALLLLMACDASRAGSGTDGNAPPAEYRLANVTLSARHQPGRSARPASGVTLFGSGRCERLDEAGEQRPCPSLEASQVLALLNAFYAIDFFDLPRSYTTRRSVVRLDDGRVRVQALRLADTGSTTLCLRIGGYKKCVTFTGRKPPFLDALAARLLALGNPPPAP